MSPEVLTESGYTQEADWWSVGCNLFEMLMGHPPFSADTPEEVFENITNWRTVLPELLEQYREYLGPDCLDLIAGLLSEPSQRLGANGIDEIRRHKFFASVDWSNLRKETPPFIPKVRYKAVLDTHIIC
jgi:serine/threonine-protein kinase RIM15